MSIAWVVNDVPCRKYYDLLKIILSAILLNVLWVACWYYESPPSLACKSAVIRFFQVMVCPWQPSRSERWCEHKLMALGWAKNDAYFSGRTAKMEIPSFCKFNTKHA